MALTKDHKELLRKSTASLEEAQSDIQSVHTELQEAFDDLSPNMQEADKGVDLTALIEQIEEADDQIGQIVGNLYAILEPLPKKTKVKV